MPLAAQALVAIPLPPMMGGPLTCHAATWFWAAQEAQAQGLTAVKAPAVTFGNIVALLPNAQAALLALPVSGTWDFTITPGVLPAAGSVLVWRGGGTHSAIVTGLNQVTGYNQGVQFPVLVAPGGPGIGHTSPPLHSLAVGHLLVDVVAEATIVAQAGALNL